MQKRLNICGDWTHHLMQAIEKPDDAFIQHSSTDRPLGSGGLIEKAKKVLNRNLQKKKPGPKVEANN